MIASAWSSREPSLDGTIIFPGRWGKQGRLSWPPTVIENQKLEHLEICASPKAKVLVVAAKMSGIEIRLVSSIRHTNTTYHNLIRVFVGRFQFRSLWLARRSAAPDKDPVSARARSCLLAERSDLIRPDLVHQEVENRLSIMTSLQFPRLLTLSACHFYITQLRTDRCFPGFVKFKMKNYSHTYIHTHILAQVLESNAMNLMGEKVPNQHDPSQWRHRQQHSNRLLKLLCDSW